MPNVHEPLVPARIGEAARGAAGRAVLLSPNPMHDTGGGQRSAQIALELVERGWFVAFVAQGRVTETVDLGKRFAHPRVAHVALDDWNAPAGREALAALLASGPALAIGQVPVRAWMPTVRAVAHARGVAVFDLIDDWDSELGWGWWNARTERKVARASDVLIASAPALARRLERIAGRPAHLLPNAYNGRIFTPGPHARPADLPVGVPIALYVGSLWGRWMDWALVRHAARAAPGIAFVFVGDYRGEGGELPPNCHFLGLKPQTELPGYLAHARVGFLPWTDDAVTQATSPLKVYEMLALGLPIVAPPTEPLRGLPGVDAPADADAFVAALHARVRDGASEAERRAMAERSAESSWSARVDALLAWTAETARTARRAALPLPFLRWPLARRE